MRHFTHLSTYNQPKNALQRAALEVLQAESNHLIDDVDAFLRKLGDAIGDLNPRHPRCGPLRLSDSRRYKDGGAVNVYLGDTFTVSFQIHPVEEAASDADA